jgi:hypothetical protein
MASTIPVGRTPTDDDLGPVFATVQFKLADNVHDLSYKLKDGDAAFLAVGTPVYAVNGYAQTFRLAARWAGRLTFYDVSENPRAKTGADLLDIGGKVSTIGIDVDEGQGTKEVAAISDAREVERLVALILAAPVAQPSLAPTGTRYFLALRLRDGTSLTRAYLPDTGLFSSLLLPLEFQRAVQKAVGT